VDSVHIGVHNEKHNKTQQNTTKHNNSRNLTKHTPLTHKGLHPPFIRGFICLSKGAHEKFKGEFQNDNKRQQNTTNYMDNVDVFQKFSMHPQTSTFVHIRQHETRITGEKQQQLATICNIRPTFIWTVSLSAST
jgi:hypothetical protein